MPDPTAQAAAAEGLSRELGLTFEAQDILLARGAHGGLATALGAVVEPGDEVVFVSPPWFFYEALILGAGATPVRVRVDETSFDLDLDALEGALTARSRAVILNTPHNPTGRLYPPATLERLAVTLESASRRNGRPICLVSDESYSRSLFDGHRFHTPARWYPYTFLVHTSSKSALAPGQRLGFVALPPTMPDRESVRLAFLAVGMALGNGLPDAIMQYALPDIERLQVDLEHCSASEIAWWVRSASRAIRSIHPRGRSISCRAVRCLTTGPSPSGSHATRLWSCRAERSRCRATCACR